MEAIKLNQPLTPVVQNELLKSLYWLDERIGRLWFEADDPQTLYLKAATGNVEPDLLAEVTRAADEQAQFLRMIPTKIAYTSDRPLPASHGDIYKQLIERGWIKESVRGAHIYSGPMARLYRALDEMIRHQSLIFSPEEIFVPNLVGLDTLETSGYINTFPHLVNFVSHLPERISAARDFRTGSNNDGLAETLDEQQPLATPDAACTASVCHHFYHMLEGQTLDSSERVAMAKGHCYRFEGKPLNGMKRLREFSMREVMFAGTKEAVMKRRQQSLETLRNLLEFCDLHFAIATASDPFILDETQKKKLFQSSFDLKYEALATLPGETTQLAIGSVNYHMDHFGKAFSIRTQSEEPAHCCCMAFGLDRWCYAICAQHGLEIDRWPANLKKLMSTPNPQAFQALEAVS